MHVVVLDVVRVRLLVVVCAESGEALVAQVCLNRVDAADEDVQAAVELLLVEDKWVVNVALHKVLVVEG